MRVQAMTNKHLKIARDFRIFTAACRRLAATDADFLRVRARGRGKCLGADRDPMFADPCAIDDDDDDLCSVCLTKKNNRSAYKSAQRKRTNALRSFRASWAKMSGWMISESIEEWKSMMDRRKGQL